MNFKKLDEVLSSIKINRKNDFYIDIVYFILNPVVSNYFNIKVKGVENLLNKDKEPILFLSKHYDELDILFQQKISKEIRAKYPYYLVKPDLKFLNAFSFGVIPYYRSKDKKLFSKNNYNKLNFPNMNSYNNYVISSIIPYIISKNNDFLIYPEGTRRGEKKFKIQKSILSNIVKIYLNSLKNIKSDNNFEDKFKINPKIVSVNIKRNLNNLVEIIYAKPLIDKNLTENILKDYLYETIN